MGIILIENLGIKLNLMNLSPAYLKEIFDVDDGLCSQDDCKLLSESVLDSELSRASFVSHCLQETKGKKDKMRVGTQWSPTGFFWLPPFLSSIFFHFSFLHVSQFTGSLWLTTP